MERVPIASIRSLTNNSRLFCSLSPWRLDQVKWLSLTAAAKRTSTPPFRPPASPSHLFYLSLSLPLNLPRLFRSVARMKEAYLSDKVSPPSRSLLRSNYGIDLAVAPSLCLALLLAGAACVALSMQPERRIGRQRSGTTKSRDA